MPQIGRGADSLQLYLSGGADNQNPDLALGGARSSHRHRGMGFIINGLPIPACVIDEVFPACGEGEASLQVDVDGQSLIFTAPDGTAGVAVPISGAETKIINGSTASKAIRVYRDLALPMPAGRLQQMTLRYPINGALGHGNVSSAQRVAGVTTYRALFILSPAFSLYNVRLWLPPVVGAQATYSIALETPVAGAVQTIASETTAPSGLSWSTPTTEGGALTIAKMLGGSTMGLWIRRVFPAAGVVSVRENVQLAIKYRGAF